MKIKVIIHEAEEGGYWAEVPSIPGCATQGESFDELLNNIYEAVDACLSIDLKDVPIWVFSWRSRHCTAAWHVRSYGERTASVRRQRAVFALPRG